MRVIEIEGGSGPAEALTIAERPDPVARPGQVLIRVRAAGVTIPLIPGVMPVSNFAGLQRMCGACGARIPDWLKAHFDGLDDDPETRKLLAASVAAETCARLQEEGFSDFHFYTLNRADLVYAICRVLGVRETATAQ